MTNKQSKKAFACKVIKLGKVRDPEIRKMLMREIAVIKMLDHPNTIKIVEVFQEYKTLYIIMELCTGGELFDRLYDQPESRFSETDARVLITKMLKGLNYLHLNGIVHRDLKLENYIFTSKEKDAEIKLIDFGYSRQYVI